MDSNHNTSGRRISTRKRTVSCRLQGLPGETGEEVLKRKKLNETEGREEHGLEEEEEERIVSVQTQQTNDITREESTNEYEGRDGTSIPDTTREHQINAVLRTDEIEVTSMREQTLRMEEEINPMVRDDEIDRTEYEMTINDLKRRISCLKQEQRRMEKYVTTLEQLNKEYVKKIEEQNSTIIILRSASIPLMDKSEDEKCKKIESIFGFEQVKQGSEEVRNLHSMMRRHRICPEIQLTLIHIYCNITKLSKLVSTDSKWKKLCLTERGGDDNDGTDKTIVHDWRTCMIAVPSIDNDNPEEETPYWTPMAVHREETIIGHQWFIPTCIMTRAKEYNFFCADECNYHRALVEYGYIHHLCVTKNTESFRRARFVAEMKKCEPMLKKLDQACNRHVGNRKRKLKLSYFKELGYKIGNIVVKKGNDRTTSMVSNVATARTSSVERDEFESVAPEQVNISQESVSMDDDEIERDNETTEMVNEIITKLYRKEENGTPNTMRWRTAKYNEICAESSKKGEDNTETNNDRLFYNEPARKAYITFRGYDVEKNQDTTILILARLDAWMTAVIEDLERKKSGCKKGGTETIILKKRFEYLLPIAVENIIKDVIGHVQHNLSDDLEQREKFMSELSIENGTTLESQLGNKDRIYTVCCRYPRNGLFYVLIRYDVILKYVCNWIGLVRDLYVGYSEKTGDRINIFNAYETVPFLSQRLSE